MMFVIAMAGESRRFRDAGYGPKFMLPLQGKPLFDHAVGSFSHYFGSGEFLFVLRPDARDFVEQRCSSLGIAGFRLAVLPEPTSGQAESVALGLDRTAVSDERPITIFNIDTVRPGYVAPPLEGEGDLEVFEGSGGLTLVDSYRRGLAGTMPGPDLVWAIAALWGALNDHEDDLAYRISGQLAPLLSLIHGLDGYVALHKYLLVKQGVLTDARARGPRAYQLDQQSAEEVDRLFDRLADTVQLAHR